MNLPLILGDIQLPAKIKDAMQMQVEADRRKRAAILESEGQRDAEINRAEGIKQRQILSSEGQRVEMINKATGESNLVSFQLFVLLFRVSLTSTYFTIFPVCFFSWILFCLVFLKI